MKKSKSTFIIESLSSETFGQALELILKNFEIEENENPELELKESISPGTYEAELEKYNSLNPRYWIIKSSKKVLGVSGMYFTPKDNHEAVWGGWTAFDVGLKSNLAIYRYELIEYVVAEAYKTGKKYGKLYTSTLPSEVQANRLYDRFGCKVYKRELSRDGTYEILYRKMEFSDLYQKFCRESPLRRR